MMFKTVAFLLCLFGVVNAHFRLLYPGPRGIFVANTEPNFCGGYNEVTTNRTTFPLSGGFFTISTGHKPWTAGVIISTVANPNSFDNFTVSGNQQLVRGYAKAENAGSFCMPLNISAANIPEVKDGANVTIQVIFDGGDGNLYQCADLTLSASLTSPPSDVTCSNATATTTPSPSTTPSQTGSSAAGLSSGASTVAALFLSLLGVVTAL